MQIDKTDIPGCLLISPKIYGDQRGFFYELYQQKRFASAELPWNFVQDNLSRSTQGTLRGLHYQLNHPQGKLVQVLQGTVFDVAVDLRRNSPAFGRSIGIVLDDSKRQQLYVPPGCAHGFYVLSESADFFYKCTDFYDPTDEHVLSWNDPLLDLRWPLIADVILSEKDQQGTPFSACDYF